MEIEVIRLGEHMPLSTRRVVRFCGETAQYETKLGLVIGLADGAVFVRDNRNNEIEMTPEEAIATANAITAAARGVEHWQKQARGYYRIRVARTGDEVWVTYQGVTHPMRLSKLRGSRRTGTLYRRCTACSEVASEMYIIDSHEHSPFAYKHPRGKPVLVGDCNWHDHAQLCVACVEQFASEPEITAQLVPMVKLPVEV